MSDDLRIGKFERVRVESDGPDVILTLPKNPARAHWTDWAQVVGGLNVKIQEAQAWERHNVTKGPGH